MPSRKSYLNRLPLAVRVPLWKLFKSGALLINDIQGDVTGDLTGDVTGDITGDITGNLNGTMTVVDSTDATSWIALFDSATGELAIKTDAGLTYNSVTGEITATLIVGPVTGDLTGDVKADDTANIVTSGANVAASSLAAGSAAITTVTGDIIGNVQADDLANIILSGADVANSHVAAGTAAITTMTGDVIGNVIADDLAAIVTSGADVANSHLAAGTAAITTMTGNVTGDVTGDILAVDSAKIVDSGADLANSIVSAGNVNVTQEFDITKAFSASVNDDGIDLNLTASGATVSGVNSVGFHMNFDISSTPAGIFYPIGIMNNMTSTHTGTLTSMEGALLNMTHNGAGTVTAVFGVESWIDRNTGAGVIGTGTCYTASLNRTAGTFTTAYGYKSMSYGVIGTVYHFYAEGDGNETLAYGVYTTSVDQDFLGADLVTVNAGILDIGVTNATAGVLNVYGRETAQTQGGKVVIYPALDWAGSFVSTTLQMTSDTFTIGPSFDTDSLTYAYGNRAWAFTEGDVVLGILDTVAGDLILHGEAAGAGATLKMYNTATATIVSYDVAITAEDLTLGPNTDPDLIKILGATTQLTVTGAGGLAVSGVGGLIITGPTSDAIQVTTVPGDGIASIIDLQISPAGSLTDDHQHTGVNVFMTSTITTAGNDYFLYGIDIDMNATGITGVSTVVGINIDTDASTDYAIYADGATAHAFFGGEMTAGVGVFTYPAVLTVDGTYNGDTISRIIDTAAAVYGEGLYLAADGNYEHSDADAAATMPVTAVACEAYEVSTAKVLMIRGMICETAWTWSAPGVILYASATAGAFTETAPAGSGDQVQVIGYALSADTIWFDPDLTLIEIA